MIPKTLYISDVSYPKLIEHINFIHLNPKYSITSLKIYANDIIFQAKVTYNKYR